MDLKLRLLIVDDEAPARAALREALANCGVPHEIVGQADGREAAVRLMDRMRPDVLLLDIRLGDGTGFEVLDQAAWKKARVIFITAYDQYAIRAFRCAAVDYLLKPVDPALLAQALERALPDCATWPRPAKNAWWCPARKGSMCWTRATSCAARPTATIHTCSRTMENAL